MARPRNLNDELAARCGADFVQDGGKLIIKCSKCGASLAEIWRTKPYVQIITKVTALCGLCGDKSFTQSVHGGFHIGHIENGEVSIKDTKPGKTSTDDKDNIVTELTILTERIT